ncbi:MAG TPA: TRAP transporter TatT component family protein, partial [Sphingomonadales bacterium]|nr:TRAP transporter TatT component family protein [Sphingomonadales bacterium]
AEKAREYYERALSYSNGDNAGLYLTLAEAVSIPEQNYAEFQRLIAAAKAVDADANPDIRLINVLAHRRAEMLGDRAGDLFLTLDE